MDQIKIVADGGDDIIDFSPDFNDGIDIQLTTPKRKAPSRRGKKPRPPKMYQPEEPPMMDDPTMDAFINPSKKQVEEDEMSFGGGGDNLYEDDEGSIQEYGDSPQLPPDPQMETVQPSKGYDSVDNEKVDLLNKFTRLDAKGIKLSKRFSAYSDIHEMRTEYQRLTYSSELEASIKFQRRVLMAASTGMEFCNKRFNPFDVKLDGWSENVMENIDEYDSIFEDLFIKYRDSVQVAPEIRLLMTLGGSAMMFHFTKTMFQAAMPSMNDVVKQNPDLVKNMVSAMAKTAQNAQQGGGDPRPIPTSTDPSAPGARREMQGPDIDMGGLFSSLMPMMGAPPPQPEDNGPPRLQPIDEMQDDDDIESLISSVETIGDEGEIKNVSLDEKKKRKRRKKAASKVVEI